MIVHSCSLNLQRAGSGGFVEIGVLDEKRSRARLRGGRNLDGEVNDAESGGLLGNHGHIARTGDGVGHAGVEAGLREKTDVGGDGAGSGASESNGISAEIARVGGSVEDAEGGDVEIEGDRGVVDAGGGGFDDDNVFAEDRGSRAGERDGVVGCAGSGDYESDDVGERTGEALDLDGNVAGLDDVRTVDWGRAGVGRGAGGDAGSASNEERGAGAGIGRNETAAVDGESETVCTAGVNTGGRQRKNVGAGGEGDVGGSRLRGAVLADGNDTDGVGCRRSGGRGKGAVGCNHAASADDGAGGALHLPDDSLIVGAE